VNGIFLKLNSFYTYFTSYVPWEKEKEKETKNRFMKSKEELKSKVVISKSFI